MITKLFAAFGDTIRADGPLIFDQVPVPEVGVFPAKEVELTLQRFWSKPAFDIEGDKADTIKLTVSLLGVQTGPLVIVHTNLYVPTESNPVIPVIGLFIAAIDAVIGPEICVQVPIPFVGVFPVIVAATETNRLVCTCI